MMRAATFAAVAVLVLHPGAEASAQVLPGNDHGSLTVHLGLFAPQTSYDDPTGGESSFASGMATGASVSTWPTQGRWGFRLQLIRSKTDGQNTQFEFAPMALNDPTQWLVSGELQLRQPMDFGNVASSPYLSAGVGAKQYNWTTSVHQEDRFFLWTAAAGFDVRHRLLGPFALTAEARGYFSKFHGFGINDGTWEPGFYGGKVGGVATRDLMFTTGFAMVF
jgi:hypothetical protein